MNQISGAVCALMPVIHKGGDYSAGIDLRRWRFESMARRRSSSLIM
jgi:hypothetical protein